MSDGFTKFRGRPVELGVDLTTLQPAADRPALGRAAPQSP